MATTLVVAGILLSWRLLRFVDDFLDGVRVGRVLSSVAVACLAAAVLTNPTAFSDATSQFLAEDIQQTTEAMMRIIQPIVDGLSQQPLNP